MWNAQQTHRIFFLISFDLVQTQQTLISWQEKSVAACYSVSQPSISFCLCPAMQVKEGHAGLMLNQLPRWRRRKIGQTGHREMQQTSTGNCIHCPGSCGSHKHHQSCRTERGPGGSQVGGTWPPCNPRMWAHPSLSAWLTSSFRGGCLERSNPQGVAPSSRCWPPWPILFSFPQSQFFNFYFKIFYL